MIVLFTALFAPYFVDWTAYKRQFEEQATKIIGQPVKVGGEAAVRLLPLPSISFGDLSVGRTKSGRPMMTVDRFSARVELMPFLSGEIRVVEMELISPDFFIDVDQSGKIAWTERQRLPVNPRQVRLDKLTVRDASFRVTGLFGEVEGAQAITGEGISANVSAQSLFGPWQIEGSGTVNGASTRFDFATGALSDRGTIRLRARAQRLDQPYELSADGPVGLEEGILAWAGTFGIRPLPAEGSVHSDAKAPLPVEVEGDFRLTPNRLNVPEYRMEIGAKEDPFVLSGRGGADLRREIDFRMEVDGRQIDIDRIARMQDGTEAAATSLEERISIVRGVLDQIPVPAFKGEIDFEIPAIVAGDTLIREVSALVRPFGDGWQVARLEASLPGNTLVEANGRLGVGDEFGFHGRLLLASRQPSGFAAWATGRVDPAIRRLSAAGMVADVTLTGNQTNLENLELRLGENVLTGQVRRLGAVFKDGQRIANPAIIAELSGDVIRLDDLRAISGIAVGGDAGLAAHDYDIAVDASNLEAFDLVVSGVDVKFQYRDGELSIARLNIQDFLGAAMTSQGQILDLLQQPRGSLSLTVAADDAAQLVGALRERWRDLPILATLATSQDLLSDTRLEFLIESRATEEGSRSRVIASGVSGGTQIALRSAISGDVSDMESLEVDFSLEARNEDPAILFRQMGAERLGFSDLYGGFNGPAVAVVEAAGNRENGYSTNASLNLLETSVSARGLVSADADGLTDFQFDFTAGAADISSYVSGFGFLIPAFTVLGESDAPFSAEGQIGYDANEKRTALTVIDGQLSGSGFTLDLVAQPGESGRPEVTGKLSADRFTARDMAGIAFGSADVLEASGIEAGGWSEANFTGPVFAGFDADIDLSFASFRVAEDSAATEFSCVFNMTDGAVELSGVSANWLGGKWSGRASLGSADGAGFGEVQFSADDVQAQMATGFAGFPNVLTGAVDGSGTIEFSGRSPLAMVSSLSGSGVIAITDSELLGISTSGLSNVLEVTDAEGFEIGSETVEPVALDAFLEGSLQISSISVPFGVTQGRIQLRNVTLNEGDRAPVANLAIDITDGSYESEITIRPDPELDAVDGADPEVTFAWERDETGGRMSTETGALEGFLSIRAFEAEQRRVELLQASILEKQRFRYELEKVRQRSRWVEARVAEELKRQEEERRAAEEAARKAAEAEARRLAEEQARREAEEAARKAAEEAARTAAEEEAARRAAEEEAAKQAEEEARRQRETEDSAGNAAEEEAAGNAGGVADTRILKEGIEVKKLPELQPRQDSPQEVPPKKPGLFENIEKFLFD